MRHFFTFKARGQGAWPGNYAPAPARRAIMHPIHPHHASTRADCVSLASAAAADADAGGVGGFYARQQELL